MYKRMKTDFKSQKGFTLVELMVVVVIIGVLVAIAVPIYNRTTIAAEQKAHDSNLRTLDGAIDQYYANAGSWPSSIADLDNYVKGASTMAVPSSLGFTETNYSFTGTGTGDRPIVGPVGTWTNHYVPVS
ncbi:MAG: prepilin-type N-terminal cleavage/methylation domain-containing protein [Bacillota bacterium]